MPSSVSALVAASLNGQESFASFRKVPSQTTVQGVWFDLSMSPGNPVPQYYAASPMVNINLARSTDVGLNHGPSVSPATKYLRRLMAMTQTTTAVPLPLILQDYLCYIPFVDMSITDPAPTTNLIGNPPRYPTGEGVKIMAVVVAPPATGGATFAVTYTNSKGVSNRVTATATCNAQFTNGTLATTNQATAGCIGPYLVLQQGDTGVRSIDSIQFFNTDVGLLSLVLVKPIATMTIYDITAPTEKDYLIDHGIMPQIMDDSYLNFIACPQGTLAGAPINGTIETLWV